jgi:hypothetical protein
MKPKCKLIGTDGNVFNLIALVSKTLEKNKLITLAEEFRNKAFNCSSYQEVIALIPNYVDIK